MQINKSGMASSTTWLPALSSLIMLWSKCISKPFFLQSQIPHYPLWLSAATKCHSIYKAYRVMLKQLLFPPHSSSVISFRLRSMSNRFLQHRCRKCKNNIQNIRKTVQIKNANNVGFEVALFALQTLFFSPTKKKKKKTSALCFRHMDCGLCQMCSQRNRHQTTQRWLWSMPHLLTPFSHGTIRKECWKEGFSSSHCSPKMMFLRL